MSIFNASTASGGEDLRCLIPGLPDEVAILCLAKVSLCYRHVTRVVCTSWRDVFESKIFWDIRPSGTFLFFRAPNSCGRHVWHCMDQSTKDWMRLPPMPVAFHVQGSLTSAVIGEKLFVIGGWCGYLGGGSPISSSKVCYFDMKGYKWLSTYPLRVARAQCSAGVIKNRLYVCGGVTEYLGYRPGQNWTSTAEVCDLSSGGGTWKFISNMRYPRKVDHGTVIDEELHVTYRVPDPPWGTKYDPLSNTWSDISHELSVILNGSPVIFNGKIFKQLGYRIDAPNTTDIVTYNAETDTTELFHRVLIEDDVVAHGKELLIFEGKLCIVHRYLQGDELRYVIRDLENRVLASAGPLDLGPRKEWLNDGWPESFEYQIMVL